MLIWLSLLTGTVVPCSHAFFLKNSCNKCDIRVPASRLSVGCFWVQNIFAVVDVTGPGCRCLLPWCLLLSALSMACAVSLYISARKPCQTCLQPILRVKQNMVILMVTRIRIALLTHRTLQVQMCFHDQTRSRRNC